MKRLVLSVLTGSVLTLSGLAGCSAQSPSGSIAESSALEAASDMAGSGTVSADEMGDIAQVPEALAQKTSAPAPGEPSEQKGATERPQLIKRAELSLRVDSVEDTFDQVREIIAVQQGDLLSLNDFGDRQRQITSELRVPQQNLDATLDALTKIGEVRSRSISTEDVSSQLVDLQARLNNSRKSEEALKEIMSRSGEISDVLEVSRELSTVRQNIEQMAAAQKSLQTRVRYSTISLSVESAIAISPTKPAFSRQLANSWGDATSSVGEFTTDLLQLGLWLLAYSPYLAVLLCGAAVANKIRRTVRNTES